MKNSIKMAAIAVSLALGASVFVGNANAAGIDISGSAGMSVLGGVTINGGADLSSFTSLTFLGSTLIGSGTVDYLNVPTAVFTMPNTPMSLSSLSSWNMSSASLGSYVVSQLIVEIQQADFLNVYTRGITTPSGSTGSQAGGCATGGNTCNATDTSLRWSFTKSGATTSVSGTLNSPSVPPSKVPEPDSIALFGVGLAALVAGSRRKSVK